MKKDIGGIYSDERCPLCEGTYVDDLVAFLSCPNHPQHIAGRFKVKFRGTTARFSKYMNASNYLKACREGHWQAGWKGEKPSAKTLGHVLDTFLDWKRELVSMGRLQLQSVTTYKNRLNRIINVIGVARDASRIKYKHVHAFLYRGGFSPKSTYDSLVVFKEMMNWALAMDEIDKVPKWPPFDFSLEHDMRRRKTVDKETQAKILHMIYITEWTRRPRLYLGVRFLCTYINIRPRELLAVQELDYNRKEESLVIRRSKTSRTPKIIRLLKQDIALLDELPRGFANMPLFRHDVPDHGIRAGERFGQSAFYRAWKRACKKLGIEGVDLYGGTRHSSAIALYKDAGVTPEEIKKATGHKTSIAFTRYFKLDIDDVVEIHALAAPDHGIVRWEKNVTALPRQRREFNVE